MAELQVLKMGHPVLRQVANKVDLSTFSIEQKSALKSLTDAMIETMHEVGGTGLAAPQIGFTDRIVVYFVKKERGELPSCKDIPMTIMVNPVITPLSNEKFYDWEGCLSVPGLRGLVPRYKRIMLEYETMNEERISVELSGFHARLVQHECDHLDGILYPQRMDDLGLLMYTDQMEFGVPEKARQILLTQSAEKATNKTD